MFQVTKPRILRNKETVLLIDRVQRTDPAAKPKDKKDALHVSFRAHTLLLWPSWSRYTGDA